MPVPVLSAGHALHQEQGRLRLLVFDVELTTVPLQARPLFQSTPLSVSPILPTSRIYLYLSPLPASSSVVGVPGPMTIRHLCRGQWQHRLYVRG